MIPNTRFSRAQSVRCCIGRSQYRIESVDRTPSDAAACYVGLREPVVSLSTRKICDARRGNGSLCRERYLFSLILIRTQRIANPEAYVVLVERVAEPGNEIMTENRRRMLAKQAAPDVRRQSV